MIRLILLVGLFTKVGIVHFPKNCKFYNRSKISDRDSWYFPYFCELDIRPKLAVNEKRFRNFRSLNKSNWEHDAHWIYANMWTDLFMPSISDNLKETGIDSMNVSNISEVVWTNALFVNFTANLSLTDGKFENISELERHGDALMSFTPDNFLLINVTIINPYIFCRFNYNIVLGVFPYVWHSGKLFADVKNVTSNLLLTLDLTNETVDLEKFTILDIESIHVTLDNNLPIFDQVASKIVNYLLPSFKAKIIQVSEETVSEEIYMRLNDIREIFF